jgi:uncharacterized protein (TIGR01244 family)
MKYGFAVFFSLIVFTFAFSQALDPIPNLQHPQYQIYTAGQPTDEGFRQLATMGIKTVINVLPEKECIPGETQIVTANGMKYITVPFNLNGFNKETILRFAQILDQVEKPVLIHCSTGNHVGGMWFAYRVIAEKAPLWLALKEARQIGMKPQLEDSLFDWVVKQSGQIS